MKPLYTPDNFNKAKSRDSLPLECYQCHKTFTTTKNEIQKYLKRQKENNPRRNQLKYCSVECRDIGKISGANIKCKQCEKIIYKQRRHINKNNNLFCSSSCAATWNNNHKTWGSRRSKLEIWLESKLTEIFPKMEIHYNSNKAVGCELDIYIPLLKLAFELNGIFHYEPIYGEKWFNNIKYNDKRKFQNCILNKISLCIIDTSSQNKFTPENSKKYLDIILNIIHIHHKNLGCYTGFDPVPQDSQS